MQEPCSNRTFHPISIHNAPWTKLALLIQICTQIRYIRLIIHNLIKDSGIGGGNVNWYNHCGKQVWRFLEKLRIELPCDPTIPLLGMYLRWEKTKTLIQKAIYTPVLTAALFIIAKIQKQPQCPSAGEWTKKMGHAHTWWNTAQSQKGTKSCHLQQCGWT